MPGSWQRVATPFGGTVAGLASVARPRLAFAATPVGVYRSVDGGSHWVLASGATTVPIASAVTVSPFFDRDHTLYACGGDGLYRSSDLGDTWQRVLIGEGMLSVATSILDPARGPVVIVGTEADGILRSDDAGHSWTGANAGLLDLAAISLAVSPCFASDRTAFAGTASGLYRTRNGARSWHAVEIERDDIAVQCLLVSPDFADDQLVLAGTETAGLLRSVDGGLSWQSPPTLNSGGVRALACANGIYVAATEPGVVVSHDGGQTWSIAFNRPEEPVLSLVFDGDGILAGLHRRGVVRSVDGGVTWHPAQEGLSARLDTELAISAEFERDPAIFVGGPEDGVRVSTDGGITWEDRKLLLTEVAVHSLSATAQRMWAATTVGVYVTEDRGDTWRRSTTDAGSARIVSAGPGRTAAALDDRRLIVSDNDANNWCDVRLPVEDPQIAAVGVARDGSVLVANTTGSDVTLWRWENLRGWSRLLVEPSTGVVRVALAVLSTEPVEPGVIVSIGRRIFRPVRDAQEVHGRERRPMWRSAELGRDVTSITALAASPVDRAVLAATNAGVFLSRDGGQTFTDWSDGLTNPRVVAIAVSPNFGEDRLVYALGLGGTIWRRSLRSL